MVKQLRYTTFAPGELEARLREMAPQGTPIPCVAQLTGSATRGGPGGTLLKAHCCKVRYLDGQEGDCQYERAGSQWHVFRYEYDALLLSRQIWMHSLGNDVGSIESKAHELAVAAYREAITQERADYFQRASEPSNGSRKKNPSLYRLTAGRAKEWAGKYAVCHRAGDVLIAIDNIYDSLDDANIAWLEKSDMRTAVGCCNRLDRCWMLPRFNPLYATFDPRPRLEAGRGEITPAIQADPKPESKVSPCADIVEADDSAAEDTGDADEDGCEYENYEEEDEEL